MLLLLTLALLSLSLLPSLAIEVTPEIPLDLISLGSKYALLLLLSLLSLLLLPMLFDTPLVLLLPLLNSGAMNVSKAGNGVGCLDMGSMGSMSMGMCASMSVSMGVSMSMNVSMGVSMSVSVRVCGC